MTQRKRECQQIQTQIQLQLLVSYNDISTIQQTIQTMHVLTQLKAIPAMKLIIQNWIFRIRT